MTEKSKKEFRLMMGEVLEQIVLPQIQELRNDINDIKEDVSILKDTTTRIELAQNSVIKRQDEQGSKIIKINKVLKLEPEA